MFRRVISRLETLNFFSSPITATNEYELRNERISTRLFILILIILILLIFTYTAQVKITQNIEVKEPSYEQFQSLTLRYQQTLRCSCDNVAIPHDSFIVLKPYFHQLCSSQFITQEWIDYIGLAAGIYLSDDFSYTGSLFFLTLASFCQLASKTLTSALQSFNSTQFITAQALSENVFIEQINTVIQTFQSLTELSFHQSFDLIQFSTHTNSLLSGLFSNIIFSIHTDTLLISSLSRFYGNNTCNCDITPSCVDPLTLQDRRIDQSNSSSYFAIPGLFKGCFLVEAVRQSSLECFYQLSCITLIKEFLQIPVILNNSILPLNSSTVSRFNVSSTVDELLAKIMTEAWQENVSHAQYFQQCQVSLCTYSVISRFNIVYIVTTLIGLVGGLTKVLRLLIPRVVKFIRRRYLPRPLVPDENRVINRSLLEHLRNFNYFSKPSLTLNEIEMKQQILATRLFFVMLIVSFIVLVSYYSAERMTYIYNIESPSFEQFINLQKDQESNPSFSCPCSTLVMTYKDFIHLDYKLHPLCSSDFVKLHEIEYPDRDRLISVDFRFGAPVFFNSLAGVCQISAHYIENSLLSFNTSLYIVNKALAPERFIQETNTIINRFISLTKRSFNRNLAINSNMTWNNGLMSGKLTNFGFYPVETNTSLSISYTPLGYSKPDNIDDFCICWVSMQCLSRWSIYVYINNFPTDVFDLPGLFTGCLPTESIRYSTLICLFNQSCVDLLSFWLNISSLTSINIDSLEHFNVNSTIADIENEIFVDRWNISISHRAFYEQCHPDRCKYTLTQHNSVWIIVTVVFGIIGGLIKILQIIVPRLVQSIFALIYWCRRRANREMTPVIASPPFSFRRILRQLYQLNLFPSDNPTVDDEREVQDQILTTRIHLILLISSLVILTIYSSQVQRTKIVTIKNPSIDQYTLLYESHSQTLTCPCQNIAIAQQTFIFLQPTFHQVCESDFVDARWLNGIFSTTLYIDVLNYDFRFIGSSIFETISSLCQLSFATINDGLGDFNASSFVSVQVIPENELVAQGQSRIDLFISTSKDAFVSALQVVRSTTYTNVLVSGFQTTTSIELRLITDTNSKFIMLPRRYNYSSSCTCSDDPTCSEPAGVYDTNSTTLLYAIPGIFIGCYMVEAALQSNLVFLYNQTQINEFREIIKFDYYSPVPFNTTALNASRNRQYNQTTLISIIMQNMMTELWFKYINYSAYYEQCQPVECTYIYIIKYDAIYIITTITGLIGGLATIYQLAIPRAIRLIRRCCLARHHRTTIQVIPIESASEN